MAGETLGGTQAVDPAGSFWGRVSTTVGGLAGDYYAFQIAKTQLEAETSSAPGEAGAAGSGSYTQQASNTPQQGLGFPAWFWPALLVVGGLLVYQGVKR